MSTTFQTAGNLNDPSKWSAGLPTVNDDAIIAADAAGAAGFTLNCKTLTITTGSIAFPVGGGCHINAVNGITVNKANGNTRAMTMTDDMCPPVQITGNLQNTAGIGFYGGNLRLTGNVNASGGVAIYNTSGIYNGIVISGDVSNDGDGTAIIMEVPTYVLCRDILNNYTDYKPTVLVKRGYLSCRNAACRQNGFPAVQVDLPDDSFGAVIPIVEITGELSDINDTGFVFISIEGAWWILILAGGIPADIGLGAAYPSLWLSGNPADLDLEGRRDNGILVIPKPAAVLNDGNVYFVNQQGTLEPFSPSFRGMAFQAGAAAGKFFHSGMVKAQSYQNGAETGAIHG